jgi:hypothetical protein
MKNTSQSQNRLKWQITKYDFLKFSLKVRVKNSKCSSILLLRQMFLRIPRSHFFPGLGNLTPLDFLCLKFHAIAYFTVLSPLHLVHFTCKRWIIVSLDCQRSTQLVVLTKQTNARYYRHLWDLLIEISWYPISLSTKSLRICIHHRNIRCFSCRGRTGHPWPN